MKRMLMTMCILGIAGLAQAGLLGVYDFEGQGAELIAKSVAADVILSDLSIGSYANSAGFTTETVIVGTPDVVNSTAIFRIYGNESAKTTADAFTGGKYLSFTISAADGKTLNLDSMSIDVQGKNIYTYFNARLFSSVQGHDAVTADTIGTFSPSYNGDRDWVTYTQSLSNPLSNASCGANILAADFQGIASVAFYLPFVQNSTSNTRWGEIDNIVISGSVVPEPATLTLLGLGGLLFSRRRK